jgi:hypothetical protein
MLFLSEMEFEIINGIIITRQVVMLVITWEPKVVMWWWVEPFLQAGFCCFLLCLCKWSLL